MHIPALGGGGEKEEKPGRERRKPLPNWPDQNVTQEQEMSHAGRAAAPRHLHRKKPHQAGNCMALLLVPAPHAPAPQPPAPLLRLPSPIGTPRPARAASPESITPATGLAVQPWIWPFNLRLGHSILHLPRPKVELPSIVVPPSPCSPPSPALDVCFAPCFGLGEEGRKPSIFAPRGAPVVHPLHKGKILPRGQQGHHHPCIQHTVPALFPAAGVGCGCPWIPTHEHLAPAGTGLRG